MITVVCYLPLSNFIQPLITWYNPFGYTLTSPTLCVHPFLSLMLRLTLVFVFSNAIAGRAVSTSRTFSIYYVFIPVAVSMWILENSNCYTQRDVGRTVSGEKEQGILCCFAGFGCRPHNSAHLGHVPCCCNRENLIKFSINILLDIFPHILGRFKS